MTFFKLFHSGIIHIRSFCYRLFWGHSFGSFGKGSVIVFPRVFNPKYIYIGKNCSIEHFTWLFAIPTELINGGKPQLVIEDDVKIGRMSEITAVSSVVLKKGVLLADNVFIADNTHHYSNIDIPIIKQGLDKLKPVEIGEYTWVGRNVCIMGCKIGRHCVIGAGSMVNKDIPDYCVVVGSPSRIVKRYNPQSGQWEKTDKDGNFIIA